MPPDLHDAALAQHVHEVGHDVFEQPLVVRDHDDRAVGAAHRVDAFGDGLERVDVEARVGLVEDRQRRLQDEHLEDLVALLLAAREALVHRPPHQLVVDVEDLQPVLAPAQEVHRVELGLAAVLPLRVQRRLEEVGVVHAGDLDRVLERHEHALAGALLGIHVEQVLAVELHRAAGHFVGGMAGQHAGQRALARAVGPHDRVHFARLHRERDALQNLAPLGARLQVP